MSKQMKAILCLVMAAALAMMTVLFLSYRSLGKDLRTVEQQLTESRETWEKIASEKEAIQVDLKAKQKEIKETQLQLDEATARAEELRQEISELTEEIEKLKH